MTAATRTAAPVTAAALAEADQPRLRRLNPSGAKVAATMSATMSGGRHRSEEKGEPDEHGTQGEQDHDPPAERAHSLQPERHGRGRASLHIGRSIPASPAEPYL